MWYGLLHEGKHSFLIMKNVVSILMYHQVGRFAKIPPDHHATLCDVRRFKIQMALIRLLGYKVISLQEACGGIFGPGKGNAPTLPRKSIVLTFDDGYQNFADNVWPILKKYRYPATVYLVANQIGQDAAWLGGEFDKSRLMDSDTIRRLSVEGVNFGSHTLSHCHLTQLNAEEKRKEIFDSKAALEKLLGKAVMDFCYPFGDYDEESRDLAQAAGYTTAVSCVRGAANTAVNVFELPRKAISYGDNMIGFFWKLAMKNKRKDMSRFSPKHVIVRAMKR
jgi:peptidoglycan/xylan/chitin deacetylase (PgdA/CDA1 family)